MVPEKMTRSHSSPELLVEAAVLDGFGDVLWLNSVLLCQIRNRPGDLGGVNAM